MCCCLKSKEYAIHIFNIRKTIKVDENYYYYLKLHDKNAYSVKKKKEKKRASGSWESPLQQ